MSLRIACSKLVQAAAKGGPAGGSFLPMVDAWERGLPDVPQCPRFPARPKASRNDARGSRAWPAQGATLSAGRELVALAQRIDVRGGELAPARVRVAASRLGGRLLLRTACSPHRGHRWQRLRPGISTLAVMATEPTPWTAFQALTVGRGGNDPGWPERVCPLATARLARSVRRSATRSPVFPTRPS